MRIALDIDDTLAETHPPVAMALNRALGLNTDWRHWHSWRIEQGFPGREAEVAAFVEDLFNDPAFMFTLRPLPFAREGVQLLDELGELYYVSARPTSQIDLTVKWLARHDFPVGEVCLGVKNKGALASSEGITLAVEDAPHHAASLATAGAWVYLLDYPWNQGLENLLSLRRVRDWHQLLQILEEEA